MSNFISNQDKKFIQLAINEAKKNLGKTYPNPSVGAALVKGDLLIDMTSTGIGGSPHAEFEILNRNNDKDLKLYTLYVTLEPCSVQGKNPACTDIIIKSGVKKVIIGCLDENPIMKGKSIKILQKHDIDVKLLNCKKSKELHKYFFHFISNKKPFLTAKIACSIDSKIATNLSESKWITSKDSRNIVHYLRSSHDAIITGVNTINIDDPELNVRIDGLKEEKTKIILDRDLTINKDAKIIKKAQISKLIIFTTSKSKNKLQFLEEKNIKIITLATKDYDNPAFILDEIAKMGVTSLFLESGTLINKFITKNLIDELHIFRSSKILGDKAINFINSEFINGLNVANFSLKNLRKINDLDHQEIYKKLQFKRVISCHVNI